MRLYLDTNVYAHAQEVGQGTDLRDWLRQAGHRVLLSDTLLGEAIAISDAAVRMARLELLGNLRSVGTGSLGELQAREFVNEVRRLRSDWRRLPVGDLATSDGMREARKAGWRLLYKDRGRLVQQIGDYHDVEKRAIQGVRAGQRTIRGDILAERTRVEEIELGDAPVSIRRLNLDDADDFCRLESLFAWYQAMIEGSPTLSEYRAYAGPYLRLRPGIETEFASFWLDEIDLARMPRGWATSLVSYAQLRSKIKHSNSADARHAGHVLDADLIVTEDERFHAALQTVACRLAGAAEPRLLARGHSDLVSQLAATAT